MNYIVCSVFDRQARQFSAPFTSFTTETAERDFARAVRDSKGHVDKFPQDFELFHLGGFDSDVGHLAVLANPVLLCKGIDFIEESL